MTTFNQEERQYIRAGSNRQQRIEQVLHARQVEQFCKSRPIVIDGDADDDSEDAALAKAQAKGG